MSPWTVEGFSNDELPGSIPLLQYADNTTFFIEGSMEEARNLSTQQDLFADRSGLQINRAKSVFIGFRLLYEETQRSGAPGMSIRMLPMSYLGLPLTRGRLSLASIIEKVERTLEGWQSILLSRGG